MADVQSLQQTVQSLQLELESVRCGRLAGQASPLSAGARGTPGGVPHEPQGQVPQSSCLVKEDALAQTVCPYTRRDAR